MVTVGELLEYVGSTDIDYAGQCLAEAQELVYKFLGTTLVAMEARALPRRTMYATPTDPELPPVEIVDRAILETGSELFHRKNAPSGLQQFATFDGVPVRLNRDPMTQSYALLAKWVVMM